MKFFLLYLLIIFSFFISNNLFSFENIYETEFYNVEINNEIINDSKIREINEIKKLSFDTLLKKILSRSEYIKLKKINKLDDEIDYLIKSILINDEFISSNRYKAKIKINFDYNEFVNFLRKNKLNYTDLSSPNFLVVAAENRNISQVGISDDNLFYDSVLPYNFNIINLIYPDVSANDRFLISYEKIVNKDIKSFNKISLKYDINNILIILLELKKAVYEINISTYSRLDDQIIDISTLKLQSKDNLKNLVFEELDNWWKKNNLINNSITNTEFCKINSSNINELHYISNIINSISQIKSNNLSEIKLNENVNKIVFFGDLNNLISKLLNKKINLYFNSNNMCIISID